MEADKIYTYTMYYSYLGLNGVEMTDTCSTSLQTRKSAIELKMESSASEIGFISKDSD